MALQQGDSKPSAARKIVILKYEVETTVPDCLKTPPSLCVLGPYRVFIKDVYKSTVAEMPPGSTSSDTMKHLAGLWKRLPLEERERYKEAAIRKREEAAQAAMVGAIP